MQNNAFIKSLSYVCITYKINDITQRKKIHKFIQINTENMLNKNSVPPQKFKNSVPI